MDLSPDITPEDLEVFLQEAQEQLELLDEEIVRLEREEDTAPLLQEIFRAAHTLKGSAGMIGHHLMANLAHSMENLLDELRQGATVVSTNIVDALLVGLDLLRAMKDDLSNSTDSQIDISEAVSVLDSLSQSSETQASDQSSASAGKEKLRLDSDHEERVHIALDAGSRVFLVKANIDPESSWIPIRCFQILDAISRSADVIISSPTFADLDENKESSLVRAVLSTEQDEEAIKKSVVAVDEVGDIEVTELNPHDPDSDVWHDLVSDSADELIAGALGDVDMAQASSPKELATVGATATNEEVGSYRAGDERGNSGVRAQPTQTVRVDVERLDNLMITIGELVIDRTRIAQIGRLLQAKYKEDELVQSLGETAAHVVKVVDELQAEIMEVRLMPIGTVFNGFPRMVRDLAQRLGKDVEFLVDGQDTEIDRTVIERIRDPLVHLLRNSIDHGIEMPEERAAAGKSERGIIRLSASQEQGSIVIRVSDDGKGINPKSLRTAAVEKGMLTPDAAERLTDPEAIDLIFAAGSSTAAETTDVSGRGVGMDIVKTNIESINGFVTVETKLGEGTAFILRLPLTLATVQALLVSVNATLFAVPAVYVVEVRRIETLEVETIEGNEVIRSRGSIVPLVRLGDVFGKKVSKQEARNSAEHVVIVKIGERPVGLAVHTLVEMQEIMVKSLSDGMGEMKGIAGASILGDGQVVLILDIPTLIQSTLMKGA